MGASTPDPIRAERHPIAQLVDEDAMQSIAFVIDCFSDAGQLPASEPAAHDLPACAHRHRSFELTPVVEASSPTLGIAA